MGVIAWIILGAISGFIASKIFEGAGKGFLMNTALGIVGAVVGGVLANLIGFGGVSGVNIWSLIVSVIGAIAVLWGYNKLTGQKL